MTRAVSRHLPWLALSLAVAACVDHHPTSPKETPGLEVPDPAAGRTLPDHYIVVLSDGADPAAVATSVGASPRFVYTSALTGFAAELSPVQLARLRQVPSVQRIQKDAVLEGGRRASLPDPARIQDIGSEGPSLTVQATTSSNWGLDRLDQVSLPLNGSYRYVNTGSGVNVYMIGTGIRTTHAQFGGRAFAGSSGFDAFPEEGKAGQDCHGTGTHAAGIVGGSTYGVAKLVRLISVRVWNCGYTGTFGGVIAGLDWVANRHAKPAVAFLDFDISFNDDVLDAALTQLLQMGIPVIGPAGDYGGVGPSCYASQEAKSIVLMVSATDASDTRMSGTVANPCTDLFAPGVAIRSAWHTSNTATWAAAALFLQAHPSAGPGRVADVILDDATQFIVKDPGYGANRLAAKLTGRITGTGGSENQPWSSSYGAPAGWHHAWLRGPAGTNFNLQLWQYTDATGWVKVVDKATTANNEYIVYRGPAGSFHWKVTSASGAGEYELYLIRP
jgi:aqualysin 1